MAMTPEEIRSILKANPIARVATVDDKGQPHVVPVTLFSDGENIYFHSSEKSQKVKNINKNPKISLVVDFFQNSPRLEVGFVMNGIAKRVENKEELEKVRNLLRQPNAPSHPDPKKPTVLSVSGEQKRSGGKMPAIIKITPTKITSWKRCELKF
jgi:nitroimidazol reductase NimA-like FMN-containing flavoprotein (pyridoxamine 5'-phosphate oxidase superfamily)